MQRRYPLVCFVDDPRQERVDYIKPSEPRATIRRPGRIGVNPRHDGLSRSMYLPAAVCISPTPLERLIIENVEGITISLDARASDEKLQRLKRNAT